MPTPAELVQSAITFFFGTALPQACGKQFADLPDPSVHLGGYTAWDGSPVTSAVGVAMTPAYALRVSPALPVTGGNPSAAGVAAPTTGPARHLLWLRNVADAAVDDAAEIQRVMADLDTFVSLFAGTGPAGGEQPALPTDTSVAAARAADWAAAVVANRATLGGDLTPLTALPPALEAVAPDLPALKEVLQHFFTFDADGKHYARWSGPGRDATNPAHLTAEYKQRNVLECKLERDRTYLYAVVPESLLTGGGDLGAPAFREFVIGFEPTGTADQPFRLEALHSARLRPAAAPFCDFVFFHAADGLGIPLPRETVSTMSTRLVDLVGQLTADDGLASAMAASPTVASAVTPGGDGGLLVHLIATVEGQPTWPPGVISASEDPVRVVLSPPAQVAAVAALPEVKHVGLLLPTQLHNDLARGAINFAALDGKMAAGPKGGNGVLVGIIDSGIDGSHPAFAGRIHAVWDQGAPTAAPGPTPQAAHPGNAAYAAFNWGSELTGAAVGTSGDPNTAQPADGHGTHVSGTAAGQEIKDVAGNVLMPAGAAQRARIAVVRGIQVRRGNPVLGVQWIFQKATELGLPCVINMSFGHHMHAHDGSDDMARSMTGFCRNGAAYRPGRILVASAGNERTDNIHVRRTLKAHSGNKTTFATVQLAGDVEEAVEIWIRDPTGTKPAAFPVRVYLFRRTLRRNTFKDITKAVTLGTQAGATAAPPTPPAGTFVNHRTAVHITSVLSSPVNGDHSFEIVFRTTDPTQRMPMIANQWGIVLVNDSASDLDVHLWTAGAPTTLMEATSDDDHKYLIGSPATGAGVISVGSSVARMNWTDSAGTGHTSTDQLRPGELSTFSSPGPLRASSVPPATFNGVGHEINDIDVTAPGGLTQSALSSQVATAPGWMASHGGEVVNNLTQVMQGTSMASPLVTGVVANLLAAKPNLTLPQVLAALTGACDIPPTSEFAPPAGSGAHPHTLDWGYGLLNASKLTP